MDTLVKELGLNKEKFYDNFGSEDAYGDLWESTDAYIMMAGDAEAMLDFIWAILSRHLFDYHTTNGHSRESATVRGLAMIE